MVFGGLGLAVCIGAMLLLLWVAVLLVRGKL